MSGRTKDPVLRQLRTLLTGLKVENRWLGGVLCFTWKGQPYSVLGDGAGYYKVVILLQRRFVTFSLSFVVDDGYSLFIKIRKHIFHATKSISN